ncbi:MAG: dicarboxylate/amino acid:cation symporter [Gammaproteobacteria bacterium]|jgi:Na+/H+-dicarboxylate symporter
MDRIKLTKQILVAMVVGFTIGALIHGFDWSENAFIGEFLVGGIFSLGGQIFIKTLKLLVVPLVFVSLVCGASSLAGGNNMGRIGLKTVALYLMTTAIAITLALTVANIINPGLGINMAEGMTFQAKEAPPFTQVVLDIFPSNPVAAMAEGNMLQIIVFALLLGVALTRAGDAGLALKASFDRWNEVIMQLVMMLMLAAPVGVFCLMVTLGAQLGFGAILDLLAYFLCVLLVLALHFLITYPTLIKLLVRVSPVLFYQHMAPVMAFAFSTASSGATLPVTLETVKKRIGVRNEIASFVVPVGATINMDGTAIMQGVATVFIAQAFNVDIGLTGYLMVILTATMASIGTAAVPGVGLITLALVLTQVGLPVEGIALIIGVDRLLDMTRTVVNVVGDATVSSVVARSEGQFEDEIFAAESAR